ncbi:MAG: hypothetical protein ABL879_04825 [Devosia sp.]
MRVQANSARLRAWRMLLDDRIASLAVPAGWIGETVGLRRYAGRLDAEGEAVSLDVGLEPLLALAPVGLVAADDGSGDIVITWEPRGRYGGTSDYLPEAYRVEIRDGVTLKRVFEAGIATVTYAMAEQTADFGAPAVGFDFTVAQVSAVHGAGHQAVGRFDA